MVHRIYMVLDSKFSRVGGLLSLTSGAEAGIHFESAAIFWMTQSDVEHASLQVKILKTWNGSKFGRSRRTFGR